MNVSDIEGGNALRGSLVRLLPLLLILILGAGIAMFGATSVLPQWRAYEQLSVERDAAQQTLDDLRSQQPQDSQVVLAGQIESASARLSESANGFVSPLQADDILDRLYVYAHNSGVQIVHLEALQPQQDARGLRSPQPTPSASSSFEQRAFRLNVVGDTRALMDFVMHVREASLPGVLISQLGLSQQEEQTSLLLDITMHISPFASGQAFADLPTVSALPTPTPIALTATSLAGTTPTPVGEAVVSMTPVADAAPVLPECPNAPPTLFTLGDTAVVDFNGAGALRILSEVGPRINTLAQAYDSQVLRLLDGPVCGQWREQPVWYWYVDDLNGTLGWVAEGPAGDRWLCPMSNPECS